MKSYPAAKTHFTDSDSLIYLVKTATIRKENFSERDDFDFASFDKSSPFFEASNNNVIGNFK